LRESNVSRAGYPLLSLILGNGTLISGLYLVVGMGTEVLRRFRPSEGVLRFAFALDALPLRVLDTLHLAGALRDAYLLGAVSGFQLRLVFGGTTLAVIFSVATVLGAFFWALHRTSLKSGG
jgi:hypothetical protein